MVFRTGHLEAISYCRVKHPQPAKPAGVFMHCHMFCAVRWQGYGVESLCTLMHCCAVFDTPSPDSCDTRMSTASSAASPWSSRKFHMPCRFFMFWAIVFVTHQVGVCIFRCTAMISRNIVMANGLGMLLLLCCILLDGFVIVKRYIHPWVVW